MDDRYPLAIPGLLFFVVVFICFFNMDRFPWEEQPPSVTVTHDTVEVVKTVTDTVFSEEVVNVPVLVSVVDSVRVPDTVRVCSRCAVWGEYAGTVPVDEGIVKYRAEVAGRFRNISLSFADLRPVTTKYITKHVLEKEAFRSGFYAGGFAGFKAFGPSFSYVRPRDAITASWDAGGGGFSVGYQRRLF
ncbi:hypothetical protein FUAX_55720 (plasmid) [Fulvitalea axinellae]|uniref:Uncharacterized protein n=1 Tax=Fulvitalea axinellae TaxID=1182444 RepID=A0AAU9DKV1_9BACT|nr:hypothetical protein FUAX_55720 [Fulvitalea axinellae]